MLMALLVLLSVTAMAATGRYDEQIQQAVRVTMPSSTLELTLCSCFAS